MSNYSEYFLNSGSNIVRLETFEISHPDFSRTYWIVRNAKNGVTCTLEDGITQEFFEYYPMSVSATGSSDDLDQTLSINLGDLGQTVPLELDNILRNSGFLTKPQLIYRIYRSDMLTQVLDGPYIFEVQNISFNKTGCTLTAGAPKVNLTQTGELYSLTRFPMLKGFL